MSVAGTIGSFPNTYAPGIPPAAGFARRRSIADMTLPASRTGRAISYRSPRLAVNFGVIWILSSTYHAK